MVIECHPVLDTLEEGDLIAWYDDDGLICEGRFLSYSHHRYIRVDTPDALCCVPLNLVVAVNGRPVQP